MAETMEIEWLEGGGVTSPAGFEAGGIYTGVKSYGPEPRMDLGVLVSVASCTAAGVFTQNRIVGAPVSLSRARLATGGGRAIVVNSGCSNVATGERGQRDAVAMADAAARRLGMSEGDVLVASTGVIGRHLDMAAIEHGIESVDISSDGGGDFARAIMTTDTVPKSRALRFRGGEHFYTIGGVAKGAGMAHPDMATVLCFLTTDAPVDRAFLQQSLAATADDSLNMLDVDMDTSTSDSMVAFANGTAGGTPIDAAHPAAGAFTTALTLLAVELARDLARDAEGATKLIEVTVRGARDKAQARRAARTVVSSPLVKAMVTGNDPNPGRILMAVGRADVDLDVDRISVAIGDQRCFERGAATDADLASISRSMQAAEVHIQVDLDVGEASATAWGCNLTAEYVSINADYTT